MTPAEIDSFQLELGGSSEVAMALMLSLMMFAVALGLRTEHFRFFKDNPKVYFAGVISQLFGLPLLTLIICYIVNPLPSMALGMILIACCPGGNTSNLLALFGKANTALSVSLTATSSIVAAFLTPVSILFWSSLYPPTRTLLTEIDLDVVSFLMQTLIILALPLVLGMGLARFKPALASKLQKPLAALAGLGLLIIIISAFTRFWPVFVAMGSFVVFLVILHNGLAFLMGYLAGVLTRADVPSRRALTFEVGIQNSGLGIVILLTQLSGLGGTGAIAGLWGTWHIIAGLMLVALFRWQDRNRNDSHV